jgi:hypothetical protein
MLKALFAIFGAVALGAGIVCTSSAAEPDAARAASDRAEIQGLMWRYVRALDSLDENAYAAVFTEDGQFGIGPNAEKGRRALKQMIVEIKRSRAEREAAGEPATPPMYHVITNSYIELIDEDHARFHGYWMTMFGPSAENSLPRVAAVGQEVDEIVREDGQWLIQLRNVRARD